MNEKIYIVPNKEELIYKSWASIILSFSTIALEKGFIIKNIYPFLYSPEGTYYMHMSILHFETVNKSIISNYLHTGKTKERYLKHNLKEVRDSLTRIRIL